MSHTTTGQDRLQADLDKPPPDARLLTEWRHEEIVLAPPRRRERSRWAPLASPRALLLLGALLGVVMLVVVLLSG